MTTYEHAETMDYIPSDLRSHGSAVGADRELVELNVILPNWQIDALEQVARNRGLTSVERHRADEVSTDPALRRKSIRCQSDIPQRSRRFLRRPAETFFGDLPVESGESDVALTIIRSASFW